MIQLRQLQVCEEWTFGSIPSFMLPLNFSNASVYFHFEEYYWSIVKHLKIVFYLPLFYFIDHFKSMPHGYSFQK